MTKLQKKKRATVFRLRKKGRVTLLKKDMFTFDFWLPGRLFYFILF